MVLNVIKKIVGLACINDALILPFATGMSIAITLLTLKSERPECKYVIQPRIDQKTCLKSIVTANLIPLVVEPKIVGEELQTDMEAINAILEDEQYKGKVLCVISTTSCFAPRAVDSVVEIAQAAKKAGIFHVVNNAYGL
jgi:O-phospho-L-seryl-tRNASec:L-selenocysteinyl-tRNA synthase